MKMGEGGAFVAGAVLGGIGGSGLGYQAGYNQRNAELMPIVNSLQNQVNAQAQQLLADVKKIKEQSEKIAELQRRLDERTAIPVISQIRNKLRGSKS